MDIFDNISNYTHTFWISLIMLTQVTYRNVFLLYCLICLFCLHVFLGLCFVKCTEHCLKALCKLNIINIVLVIINAVNLLDTAGDHVISTWQ